MRGDAMPFLLMLLAAILVSALAWAFLVCLFTLAEG
jgi:hypothetical protein